MRFVNRLIAVTLITIILISLLLYRKRSTHCYAIDPNYPTIDYTNIAKKIFMTDKSLNKVYPEVIASWQNKNQGYEFEFYDDSKADKFVKDNMSQEIYEIYKSLPRPVLKADFFRYIKLYVDGGIYSDTDTLCIKPINAWSDGEDSEAIIAIEHYDLDDVGDCVEESYARDIQFIQWTMASKPKHPILESVINKIKDISPKMFNKAEIGYCDVLDWTGPGIWSDAIMEYLNLNDTSALDIEKGTTIKNVRILPRVAFTVSDTDFHPEGKVQHLFWGTWKKKSSPLSLLYQNIERKLYLNLRCA